MHVWHGTRWGESNVCTYNSRAVHSGQARGREVNWTEVGGETGQNNQEASKVVE